MQRLREHVLHLHIFDDVSHDGKSPRQITPAAYKKRWLIRGAKSRVTLTSPCAKSTFQSKETVNRAFYAL